MTAFGGVTATLQIGSNTIKWNVASIQNSVLIGMDLLNYLNVVIHTGQDNFRIGKEICVFSSPEAKAQVSFSA